MHPADIWNMFYLQSNKINFYLRIGLIICAFAMGNKSIAQNIHAYSSKNMSDYDERKLHYGFSIGLNNSRYDIIHSDYFINNNDSLLAVTPLGTTSFTLGFVVNYHINDVLDIRALPNVGFYNRDVLYSFREGTFNEVLEKPLRQLESTIIEMPILLKYKSMRHKNFRVYVVGGVKPGIEINNKRKLNRETILRVKPADLAIEYGIGFDIYYPMFKFSPEIRFSHGLPNLLVPDDNVFANSLQRLSSHTVTLFFHFE